MEGRRPGHGSPHDVASASERQGAAVAVGGAEAADIRVAAETAVGCSSSNAGQAFFAGLTGGGPGKPRAPVVGERARGRARPTRRERVFAACGTNVLNSRNAFHASLHRNPRTRRSRGSFGESPKATYRRTIPVVIPPRKPTTPAQRGSMGRVPQTCSNTRNHARPAAHRRRPVQRGRFLCARGPLMRVTRPCPRGKGSCMLVGTL